MVGAHDVGEHGGFLDAGLETFGDEEVVDTPADVTLAGECLVGPPAVSFLFVGIEHSEGVGKSCLREMIHINSFLGKETRNFGVGLRVAKVDLLMRGVYVAAADDFLALRLKLLYLI